jgi:hypothetical protein
MALAASALFRNHFVDLKAGFGSTRCTSYHDT